MATQSTTATVPILDLAGKSIGTKELNPEIFGGEINKKTLRYYLHVYLKNQRQGNAATKTRGEVNATTKKLYRQKGTGGARHGSKRAPLFVGGGVTFGPQPKDISVTITKKQKRIALFSSLAAKSQEKAILCLTNEATKIEKPSTKSVYAFLKSTELTGKKVLMVVDSVGNNLVRSSRNLKSVDLAEVYTLDAYTILCHDAIVFTEEALDSLTTHFLRTI
ncbi:MAG: 50S ribosomal protein L4 [Patescibacteria group bacterium]|nr:50S ribosomal protein L4 [Patescibacteria group bacterium]